jgi:hypothetical protein
LNESRDGRFWHDAAVSLQRIYLVAPGAIADINGAYVIASGSDKVFVQADVALLPALFVRNPGWHPMFDFDPDVAEQTRRKVYDMLAAEKMLLQGFHYPFPGLAHIEKSGTGYREILVVWNPTI